MRYFEYIWAAIAYGTPWLMGSGSLQMLFWFVGMIAPLIFSTGLIFKFDKIAMTLAILSMSIAVALIVSWLVEIDYWFRAPPPASCGQDACDNDAEIRTLFMAGAIFLPIAIPSIIFSPIAIFVSLRRILTKRKMKLLQST